jgi:mRNA interferase RelE/StbE
VTYRLALAPSAERAVGELPERYAAAILEFMVGPLIENPRRVGGDLRDERAGFRSARIGAYRVVYRIDEAAGVVRVVRVAHRADVYRG